MLYDQYFIDDLKDRADLVRRFIVVWVSVFAFAVSGAGQVPQGAVLVDEIGSFQCDGFRGWVDIILSELRDNPGSNALVVNIGRGEREIWAVQREEMIRNHIEFRNFDASRIQFSRSIGDEFKTQFFRIPRQKDSISKRNYILLSLTAPVVIEEHDFDDLCPPLHSKELVATILEQNPGIRATVLVRDDSVGKTQKRLDDISKYLSHQRRIDPGRIKFFSQVKREFVYGTDAYFEFRLIP